MSDPAEDHRHQRGREIADKARGFLSNLGNTHQQLVVIPIKMI